LSISQLAPGFAGLVSGYMTSIPAEWQATLGGDLLLGQCCIPIIGRTSWGPGIAVAKLSDVGTVNPVPAFVVLNYNQDHPTLGTCDSSGHSWNCTAQMGGVVFPAGTRSVLFIGAVGTGPNCYGEPTSDPTLNGKPTGGGDMWCYDPTGGDKGPHAYPYVSKVWAYDANDFVAVKAGTKHAWEIKPYAEWTFDLPGQAAVHTIRGATYDPATKRLFMTDRWSQLIHVFTVNVGPPPRSDDQLSLSATVMGSGRITSVPAGLSCPVMACSPTFPTGTTVRLMAVPSRGWTFSGWGGVCAGTSPCSVLMSSAQSVTATFTQVVGSYTLSATITGSGTVTSAPAGLTCTGGTCSANFASSTLVLLAATPASGWVFSGWGGACAGGGDCSVAMTSPKSVTAMFARLPPTVPVEPTFTTNALSGRGSLRRLGWAFRAQWAPGGVRPRTLHHGLKQEYAESRFLSPPM
jgi:hypothetical protein